MNRREAICQGGRFAGAAALWASLGGSTWAALPAPRGWSPAEEDMLTLVGDTILPATADSPGAGSVGIGRFMAMMVAECYPPEAAETLRRGLREIQAQSHADFARTFAALTVAQREALLTRYETPGAATVKALHPFRLLKELTLLGYFTSEPGATRSLRYEPVPGDYRGSVRLSPSERSWAL